MKGKKKKAQAPLPTAQNIQPLIDAQQRASQVGVETPFGSQTYRTNPDGTRTLVTSLDGPGAALADRALSLGMIDSQQVGVPDQINQIAQGLANRVGGRFGVSPQSGLTLGSSKPQGQLQLLPPSR
jgi:hypothetical protein